MSALTTQQTGALVPQTEEDLIRVLQNSLYPGAQIGSVQMVLGYCQAAGLDPMQKPVHIVPMWDSKSGSMRDVVMPGVNLYRTQASRTGRFAGMSDPEFGPMVETTLAGVPIRYPEWCRVVVKRLLDNGTVAEFSAIEYWDENYAMKGGKEKSIAPNAMWAKRPRGQIAKCAEAQALRKAFPECGAQPTAEEMEGKQMHPEVDITPTATVTQDWVAAARACTNATELAAVWKTGVAEIRLAGNKPLYDELKKVVEERGKAFAAKPAEVEMNDVPVEPAEPVAQQSDADFVAGLDGVE